MIIALVNVTFYIPASSHIPVVLQQSLPKKRYCSRNAHFRPNKQLTAVYYLHNQTLCWKLKHMTMRSKRIVDNETFGVTEQKKWRRRDNVSSQVLSSKGEIFTEDNNSTAWVVSHFCLRTGDSISDT
jgi:hypothetical protein